MSVGVAPPKFYSINVLQHECDTWGSLAIRNCSKWHIFFHTFGVSQLEQLALPSLRFVYQSINPGCYSNSFDAHGPENRFFRSARFFFQNGLPKLSGKIRTIKTTCRAKFPSKMTCSNCQNKTHTHTHMGGSKLFDF